MTLHVCSGNNWFFFDGIDINENGANLKHPAYILFILQHLSE